MKQKFNGRICFYMVKTGAFFSCLRYNKKSPPWLFWRKLNIMNIGDRENDHKLERVMIDFIKGRIVSTESDHVIVENQGMGYRIATSTQSASDFMIPGEIVTIYTEMIVREDAISLVGFATREERRMFRLLTSVSGVGTRVAINVLSSLPYHRLAFIIASGDVKTLTSAQGIGKKTAERILLELKDKIGALETSEETMQVANAASMPSVRNDAIDALITLGYTRAEAQLALSKLDLSHGSVEQAIREALNQLMKS